MTFPLDVLFLTVACCTSSHHTLYFCRRKVVPTISKQSEIRLLLKTDKVRQQLFDNLQPNLQPTCNLEQTSFFKVCTAPCHGLRYNTQTSPTARTKSISLQILEFRFFRHYMNRKEAIYPNGITSHDLKVEVQRP